MTRRTVRGLGSLLVLLAVLAGTAGAHGKAKHKAKPRRIEITVTKQGFVPKGIQVKKDEQVTLVFTRKVERTCAKEVIVYLADDKKVEKKLPLDQPVEITVKFEKSGELGYACAMGHLGGVIKVE